MSSAADSEATASLSFYDHPEDTIRQRFIEQLNAEGGYRTESILLAGNKSMSERWTNLPVAQEFNINMGNYFSTAKNHLHETFLVKKKFC